MTSPYAPNEDKIKTTEDLFGRYHLVNKKGKPRSERETLLAYFCEKTGYTPARMAFKLAHLRELKDLYYLKSLADSYEWEGKGPWRKAFFGSLKPTKQALEQLLALTPTATPKGGEG